MILHYIGLVFFFFLIHQVDWTRGSCFTFVCFSFFLTKNWDWNSYAFPSEITVWLYIFWLPLQWQRIQNLAISTFQLKAQQRKLMLPNLRSENRAAQHFRVPAPWQRASDFEERRATVSSASHGPLTRPYCSTRTVKAPKDCGELDLNLLQCRFFCRWKVQGMSGEQPRNRGASLGRQCEVHDPRRSSEPGDCCSFAFIALIWWKIWCVRSLQCGGY